MPGENSPALRFDELLLPGNQPEAAQPACVYLSQLALGSRRAMQYAVNVIAATLVEATVTAEQINWGQLRGAHIADLLPELVQRYPHAAMQKKLLSALRGVLRAAYQLEQLPSTAYYDALAELDKGIAKHREQIRAAPALVAQRAVTDSDVHALLAACARDLAPAGRRDAAILAMLYGAGLRRSQIVMLDLADYDPQVRTIAVEGETMLLPQGTVQALDDWLAVRGRAPGPLFVSFDQYGQMKGKTAGRRLHHQTVFTVLRRRVQAAGIAEMSIEDIRRAHRTAIEKHRSIAASQLQVPYVAPIVPPAER